MSKSTKGYKVTRIRPQSSSLTVGLLFKKHFKSTKEIQHQWVCLGLQASTVAHIRSALKKSSCLHSFGSFHWGIWDQLLQKRRLCCAADQILMEQLCVKKVPTFIRHKLTLPKKPPHYSHCKCFPSYSQMVFMLLVCKLYLRLGWLQ